ncbi:hypothetical protein HDV00_002647 [Rhizophlyctis rosea]|nr:hypothetical protein HDV00_002647 [Rhizophlyctis rosea]
MPTTLLTRLETLTEELTTIYTQNPRVIDLYIKNHLKKAGTEQVPSHAPDGVRKVEEGTKAVGLRRCARFYEVESERKLRSSISSLRKTSDKVEPSHVPVRRSFRLLAPSTAHLCKSIIFENTRWKPSKNQFDPKNSQYYCVIVQYVDKLNTQKLMNYVRELGNKEIPKKYYNMRVAPEEKSFELSGYENNAVSPFGMNAPLPIIITENIAKLQPPIFFVGAGHVDWKVAVPLADFIKATGCYVTDLE